MLATFTYPRDWIYILQNLQGQLVGFQFLIFALISSRMAYHTFGPKCLNASNPQLVILGLTGL